MTDNRRGEAIEIVARRIVADTHDNDPDDLYLDDLNFTDEDVRAVVGQVRSVIDGLRPSDEEYEAAASFLDAGDDDEDEDDE